MRYVLFLNLVITIWIDPQHLFFGFIIEGVTTNFGKLAGAVFERASLKSACIVYDRVVIFHGPIGIAQLTFFPIYFQF